MPKTATKAAPKRKAGPGLSKPVTPSAALAAIVGAGPFTRAEVTAKLWDYIRANKLQDPTDKRVIVADAPLRAVFGQDRATMFEMNRLIAGQMTAA